MENTEEVLPIESRNSLGWWLAAVFGLVACLIYNIVVNFVQEEEIRKLGKDVRILQQQFEQQQIHQTDLAKRAVHLETGLENVIDREYFFPWWSKEKPKGQQEDLPKDLPDDAGVDNVDSTTM